MSVAVIRKLSRNERVPAKHQVGMRRFLLRIEDPGKDCADSW